MALTLPADRNDRVQIAVATYLVDIVRLAYTYVGRIADAQDIAQEVFLTYLEKAPLLESEAHEKAWLIRVTINKCKDHVKSSWFRKFVPIDERIGYRPILDASDGLLEIVQALDEKYRLPIHLHYYEGYSVKEVAQILQINASTIATRLERGRNQIRSRLEKLAPDGQVLTNQNTAERSDSP